MTGVTTRTGVDPSDPAAGRSLQRLTSWIAGRGRWAGWLGFAAGAYATRASVARPVLVGDDVPYHLLRVRFGLHELFLRGRLDGWSPIFGAGSQHFLVYGPGLTLGFAVVKAVTLGQLSDARSLAVLAWLTFAAIGPAMFYLARSLRLPTLHAGLAGLGALAVSVPFGVGVSGTFDIGLLAHGAAAPLATVALGLVVRCVDDRRWRPALLGATVALLVLTHPASAVMFGLSTIIVLPFAARGRRLTSIVGRLARPVGIAGGLAAFWWIPLALRHSPMQPSPTWPTPTLPERIEAMMRGQFAFSPAIGAVVALAALGLAGALMNPDAPVWRNRIGAGLVIVPVAVLCATFGLAGAFPDALAATLLPNRGAGMVALWFVLGAAAFVGEALTTAVRTTAGRAVPGWVVVTFSVAVAAFLALDPDAIPALGRTRSIERLPEQVEAIGAHLRSSTPPQTRVAVSNDRGLDEAIGRLNVPFWVAAVAQRPVLSDFGSNDVTPFDNYVSLALFGPVPDNRTEQAFWADVDRRIVGAGVRRIVVGSEHRAEMDRRPGWRLDWDNGVSSIYAWDPPADHPAADALVVSDQPAAATLRSYGNEDLEWDLDIRQPTNLTVGVAAFDKWEAEVDGAPVPIAQQDGLSVVQVSPGAGRLTMSYRRDLGDLLGTLISFGTAGWLCWNHRWLAPLRRAVRRRRSSAPAASLTE